MYIRLTDLKSNMDRFISSKYVVVQVGYCYLKSNMDRFISKTLYRYLHICFHLKSNMDRFIDGTGEYIAEEYTI